MIIHVEPGNITNHLMRYFFARHVQRRIPSATLTGYRMPEFGLVSDVPKAGNLLSIGLKQRIDVDALLRDMSGGGYDGLLVDCYAARMEYFEADRILLAQLLQSSEEGHATTASDIVINIRGGEILRGIHPDYSPLPFAFYRRVIRETGLNPVFVGQIGDNEYGRALRLAFPDARYPKSDRWIEDFQTVRNAKNIVVAVSTFSWMAAWLSTSASMIHLPMAGFLNPEQRPDIDLLPRNDPRYVSYEFPVLRFDGSAAQMAKLMD